MKKKYIQIFIVIIAFSGIAYLCDATEKAKFEPMYRENGNLEAKVKYDSDGNIETFISYDMDGVKSRKSEYDENENLIKIRYYNPDGSVDFSIETEVDADGKE